MDHTFALLEHITETCQRSLKRCDFLVASVTYILLVSFQKLNPQDQSFGGEAARIIIDG